MPLTAVRLGERKEEIPVGPFACPQGFLWAHVDGFETRLGFVACRADVHANSAAGAVFGGNLPSISQAPPIGVAGRDRFESLRRARERRRFIHFAANHGMRTNEHALAALNANVRV